MGHGEDFWADVLGEIGMGKCSIDRKFATATENEVLRRMHFRLMQIILAMALRCSLSVVIFGTIIHRMVVEHSRNIAEIAKIEIEVNGVSDSSSRDGSKVTNSIHTRKLMDSIK